LSAAFIEGAATASSKKPDSVTKVLSLRGIAHLSTRITPVGIQKALLHCGEGGRFVRLGLISVQQ